MTCPAVRNVSGLTIACTKPDGHYRQLEPPAKGNPHKSGWIALSLMQRMMVGASQIRVEWFD